MRNLLIILCLTLASLTVSAQFQVGAFAGISNYYGDLTDKFFNQPQPAFGLSLGYQFSEKFLLRSSITMGKLKGSDQYGGSEYLAATRNLDFESKLQEVSLVGELTLLRYQAFNWSPYCFAGLSVFHHNPYIKGAEGERIYLQPLGTEGQGLPGYQSKPYSLTNVAVPLGAGIKFFLSETNSLGLEIGYRKTFTDYIDDVSSNYADRSDLIAGRGYTSADYAYRADENPLGRSTYPTKGEMRGNSAKMDSYYFTGIHFTHSLSSGDSRIDKRTGEYKCPKVAW